MHSTAKNKITQNPLLSISETNKTWRTAAGVETSSRLGIAHSPAPDFKSVEPDKGSGFDTPQKGAKIPQSAATTKPAQLPHGVRKRRETPAE